MLRVVNSIQLQRQRTKQLIAAGAGEETRQGRCEGGVTIPSVVKEYLCNSNGADEVKSGLFSGERFYDAEQKPAGGVVV